MNKSTLFLVASIVALSILVSAGPTLVALARAITPLVIAVGSVAIAARIVWYFTSRY